MKKPENKSILMDESWKEIVGYNGKYEASNFGNIRKTADKISLKLYIQNRGYNTVNLSKDKKSKGMLLHRIIAQTFIPNPENKPQVNHINGIKTDNRVENLEWNTSSENVIHSINTGLRPVLHGCRHGMSKLKEQDVLNIRHIYSNKEMNQTQIAEFFNIKQTTVSQIINKSRWAHI